MSRCDHCPIARDTPCAGERHGYRESVCGRVRSADPHAAAHARYLATRAAKAPPVGPPWLADAPPAYLASATTVADSPDRPRRRHRLAEVKSCPARVRVGCGCNGETYCRVRELARVSYQDCQSCVDKG